jgi:ABC-type polysaccharide/polyol phosphate transport system ATPase subunit
LPATVPHTAQERAEALAGAPRAVTVHGVSKAFRRSHQQVSTLKERVLHPRRSTTHDLLRALEDIDFAVSQGEFFGIVGRNGSGKSTLLKCLAGIYDIDAGDIRIAGRLSPFIELGVGFNPDLTARDNVVINAIMLGLTRKQARDRFDEIVAFAELEDYLDLKLKNYSSGMNVRLAFSVAIQVDADVLLVDEVLAVGDAAFQQKCFEQFQAMKAAGRTILFVTHDMGAVERFCDRAMLIERGRMVDIGSPSTIARKYNELNFGRTVHQLPEGDRFGDQLSAEIRDCWFEDERGEPIDALAQGETCVIRMLVRFHQPVEDPVFAVTLRNDAHHTIFAISSQWEHGSTGRFTPGEEANIAIRFENRLAPSRYSATPSVARIGGTDALDLRENLAALMVHGTRATGGVVDLEHDFEVQRS